MIDDGAYFIGVIPKYLVRDRTGKVIHVASCPRAGNNPYPWHWADDQTITTIRNVAAHFGYRGCKYCNPLGQSRPGVMSNTTT